jgi:uncharacterized LabA/DUF88 family protein
MCKTAVFIDGGYFKKILKDVFGEPTIDYAEFCDKICVAHKAERLRTYYYDCMPIQPINPTVIERTRYQGMQKFIRYLQMSPRFEIRLGKLQQIGLEPPKQKRIDVLLSVDLVRMSWDHQIESAIIISGDSDFVPAIKAAKDAGVVTILYYSRGAPTVYAHDELLLECDERVEISKGLIDSVTKQKQTPP